MKRLLICALLLLMPVMALAQSQFNVAQNDDQYLRIIKGRETGLKPGDTGTLTDAFGADFGSLTVIAAEDGYSIARVTLEPDRLITELKRADIESVAMHDVPFVFINSASFVIIDRGEKQGVAVNQKGKMFDETGGLVGYFRVLSVNPESSVAFISQLAANRRYDEARSGIFMDYVNQIAESTGVTNFDIGNLVMIVIGLLFIYIAIAKDYEPLLLVPIGFGVLVGNIPLPVQIFNSISIYMIDPLTGAYVFNTTGQSVLGILYTLVTSGIFPPLIFLGIGAMTDFSTLLSNPKTVLLGAAAQVGIFLTFIGALILGFSPQAAASIGIIGGADGPTAIFLTSKLAPALIGPIAIAAYSYMGLVPIIQPPIMRLLTSKKERLIRMKPGRKVGKVEKILFPIAGFLITTFIAPGAIPLLGMLFFGNLLKESGVTARLAKTASSALIDICTMLLGLVVGASTTAQVFLNTTSVLIFALGCASFAVATAGGLLFAKLMNLFLREGNKINPLIGAAGVSAVPDSARVAEMVGREYDPNNHLLMHAMGPNVAGVIGSAIAAGVLLGIF